MSLVRVFFWLTFVLGLSMPAAAQVCDTPMPGYKVTAPAASVVPDQARFIGVWKGKWEDKLCHTFVVMSIDADEVEVIYSFGVYEPWGIKAGGYGRYIAKFDGEMLRLPTFRNGADASYRFDGGVLTGRYVTKRGGVSYVRLEEASN